MAERVSMLAEIVDVEGSHVRIRVGAEGHQHRILFGPVWPNEAKAFRDAMKRKEKVRVTIDVPPTEKENREAAESMVRDMAGEIEG